MHSTLRISIFNALTGESTREVRSLLYANRPSKFNHANFNQNSLGFLLNMPIIAFLASTRLLFDAVLTNLKFLYSSARHRKRERPGMALAI